MRLRARLGCLLFGHRPVGGRATYDISAGSFVDVVKTQYAVCDRCGAVRPARLSVVDNEGGGENQDRGQGVGGGEDAPGGNEVEPTREAEGDDGDGLGAGDGATATVTDGAGDRERHERDADGERSPSVTGAG
jgi:hypothetical protein